MDLTLAASVAAMISGAGACASALATWRTVREMQKQCEAAYMPNFASSLPLITGMNTAPLIKIFNIGEGAARNVDVSIKVSAEFVKAMDDALAKSGVRIKIAGDTSSIEKRFPDGGVALERFSMTCAAHASFVLPGMENAMPMRTPAYMHALVSLAVENLFPKKNREIGKVLETLYLEMVISFQDIGGKERLAILRHKFLDIQYEWSEQTFALHFV